ncbi:hypothetical protein SLE2022_116840 [Rubroshorea leprosula]
MLDVESYNVKALYRRAQAFMEISDLVLAELDIKKALEADPQNREVKQIQKTLKQLQAESNKRDAKLYSNMFARMTKDSSTTTKKMKLEKAENEKQEEAAAMEVESNTDNSAAPSEKWLLMRLAISASAIKFLPGYEGPLPFHLETGYVGVGESEEVQLFYYFVKSEKNPEEDPLLLWLTGGPGCTAFSAFAYEIGPLNFKVEEYNGSLPKLTLNPYSWTKVASIIFVDSPVGTGYSYSRKPLASPSGDFKQVHQLHQFLRKWIIDHPEFISSPVYVGGDSYSGVIVPALLQEISYGNEEQHISPLINVKGYILGNPKLNSSLESSFEIPFAHGMGLISDELYESLTKSCGGGEKGDVDPSNIECWENLQYYYKCISGIQIAQILEPLCGFALRKQPEMSGKRRYLHELLLDPEPPIPLDCRTYGYLLAGYWANDDSVRFALHIIKGSIGEWQRCKSGLFYDSDIPDSFQYHANLSTKGYRALIYSGDHDMLVPFMSTQAWIRSLNYPIVDDWRPWILEGQVAGYTRTYSNRMTFATIKGGGHTAPEYRPAECQAMFDRCRAWKDVIFWVKKENDKPDSSCKHYHESFLRRTLALQ